MTRERLAKQKLEFDQLYLLPKISESCPNIGFMEFIRNFGDGTALKKKLLVE